MPARTNPAIVILRSTLLAAGLLLLGACAGAPKRTLFVVPNTLPNGQSSEQRRAALETWMADRAGGFTEMGEVNGAWKTPKGEVLREKNRMYLITVEDDPEAFREALREKIITEFEQEEAYLEAF